MALLGPFHCHRFRRSPDIKKFPRRCVTSTRTASRTPHHCSCPESSVKPLPEVRERNTQSRRLLASESFQVDENSPHHHLFTLPKISVYAVVQKKSQARLTDLTRFWLCFRTGHSNFVPKFRPDSDFRSVTQRDYRRKITSFRPCRPYHPYHPCHQALQELQKNYRCLVFQRSLLLWLGVMRQLKLRW